jgi:N utilization substance protein B
MLSRRKARQKVLELLYQCDIADVPLVTAVERYQEQEQSQLQTEGELSQIPFAQELLHQAVEHQVEIDTLIKDTVEHWRFDRIAIVDRNILRMTIAELLYLENIPVNVTINEAIELAKKYSTADSGRFVNGVLDKIVQLKNLKKKQ